MVTPENSIRFEFKTDLRTDSKKNVNICHCVTSFKISGFLTAFESRILEESSYLES